MMTLTSESGYTTNEKCIDGIFPRKHKHKHKYKHKDKPVKIPVDKETKIVEMASKNPRMLWPTFLYMAIEDTGMTEYVSKEINLVDSEVTPRLETYS